MPRSIAYSANSPTVTDTNPPKVLFEYMFEYCRHTPATFSNYYVDRPPISLWESQRAKLAIVRGRRGKLY